VWRPWRPCPVVVVRGFFYSQPDWHHHHVKVVHRPVYAHPHQPHTAPGKWQRQAPVHRVQGTVAKPYVRVPESQRKPIVQQHQPQPMPAANGFSQRREHHADDSRREHRSAEPPREHRSDGQHNQRGRDSRGGGGGSSSGGGGGHGGGGQRGHR